MRLDCNGRGVRKNTHFQCVEEFNDVQLFREYTKCKQTN